MSTYIEHVNSFDPSALDDNLDDMPNSTVPPATPAGASGSGSPSKRARS